ncbi:MAG: hypothetical protein O3A47_02530 [Chloroflexi bacterium]|nr:hypothetical protein [Chloroflexota bacterium]
MRRRIQWEAYAWSLQQHKQDKQHSDAVARYVEIIRDHGGPLNSTVQMTAFVSVATMVLVDEGALPGSERLIDIW